ncbi:MAG: GNAT family N-acetyltransferase [Pirellulales bacterium]|nr:GNAT family N-acetyltransferase [Pirellulales bacterium]
MTVEILHLDSVAELRRSAGAWDDLWARSAVTYPTAQAALVVQWLERFAPEAEFRTVVVQSGGCWQAALPLISRRRGRFLTLGVQPCNPWSSAGDLLAADPPAESVFDALVDALEDLPFRVLVCDETLLGSPHWRALDQAFLRRRKKTVLRPRYAVGRVEVRGDWEAYQARWSRKHRQKMAWALRQLARQGQLRLELLSRLPPEDVGRCLHCGWEIEDRSWKGKSGTSVLRTPGMEGFYRRQAELLAERGQLELAFLRGGDRVLAFCFGQTAKGVFHSVKTAYDPVWAAYSPGQVLRYLLLERFFREPERRAFDFLGPMTAAHAAWRPAQTTVARWIAAPWGGWGKWALQGYEFWRSKVESRRSIFDFPFSTLDFRPSTFLTPPPRRDPPAAVPR